MVKTSKNAWETYIEKTLAVAHELDGGALLLKDALTRLMDAAPGVAPEVEEFILNTFSEIDGSPDDYEETINLIQSRPSQKEIEDFMKKP